MNLLLTQRRYLYITVGHMTSQKTFGSDQKMINNCGKQKRKERKNRKQNNSRVQGILIP